MFHDAAGAPLYSPYWLGQAIPAMLLAHLVVAGFAEGALSGGVIAYLQRANQPLLRLNHPDVSADGDRVTHRVRPSAVAGIAVGIMVLLTPIGLLAPGGAFGEDAPANLDLAKVKLQAIPEGLNKYNGFWHNALFNGYDFGGDAHPWLGYLVSAVVGIAVVGLVVLVIGKLVARFARRDAEVAS